ncbi:hypothetical protein DOS84_03600 [Flavobacterium aquariorum]|uniref:Uncharacterized protein n=1 Tax=Flavobacterium aquariorum TaxID=2217670 RepID=A0A2W7VRC3_9FLAO|nr:hypothetical protein DOS84_03600 [Flavobacterium aquariorum]
MVDIINLNIKIVLYLIGIKQHYKYKIILKKNSIFYQLNNCNSVSYILKNMIKVIFLYSKKKYKISLTRETKIKKQRF